MRIRRRGNCLPPVVVDTCDDRCPMVVVDRLIEWPEIGAPHQGAECVNTVSTLQPLEVSPACEPL